MDGLYEPYSASAGKQAADLYNKRLPDPDTQHESVRIILADLHAITLCRRETSSESVQSFAQ